MHHMGRPARLSSGWHRAPSPSRTLRAAQARGGLGRTRPSLTAAAPDARDCSGLDGKTAPQPNQKTSIVVAGRRALQRSQTARAFTSSWRVAFTACGDPRNGGRILSVFGFRVSGVGFGPRATWVLPGCHAIHMGDECPGFPDVVPAAKVHRRERSVCSH